MVVKREAFLGSSSSAVVVVVEVKLGSVRTVAVDLEATKGCRLVSTNGRRKEGRAGENASKKGNKVVMNARGVYLAKDEDSQAPRRGGSVKSALYWFAELRA